MPGQRRRFPIAMLLAAALSLPGGLWAQDDPPLPEPDPTSPAAVRPEPEPAIEAPEEVPLAPAVSRLIGDPVTSEAERLRLQVFHGQWGEDVEAFAEGLPAGLRAELALLRHRLGAPELRDAASPALVRAEAAVAAQGEGARGRVEALLEGDGTARAAVLRAEAALLEGDTAGAVAALRPVREGFARASEGAPPAELVAAAEAITLLAALEGRPAEDYGRAMRLLGRARELDPLHWPAHVAEGVLLVSKDNRLEGYEALVQALTLNPKAAEAWFQIGLMAVEGFNFDGAREATEKLREINPDHVLASVLEARSLLQQRDVDGAQATLEKALAVYPTHRELMALQAASYALRYDEEATRQALEALDALTPGTPRGYFVVGGVLSAARQYAEGAAMLREAIERQPNDPDAWIELGLLLMQDGDVAAARETLARATSLDPFNRRAVNQLHLADEILGYETIETEHFVIRYKKGIDAVLARDMPDELERIYREITSVFQHRPERKTQIDIMPDDRYFGVRITGMPEIWTIAAATGDVLSLTPPREGKRQRGPYHWPNVLRHEFVHTVTLSQTKNRIPHWFTEACAVSQETTGRDYRTCQMLAWALHNDELFTLESVNWGFIRPQREIDRPLAYAQSDWMLEYIAHRWGHGAIIDLLDLYREGTPDAEAMRRVTGETPEAFIEGFKAWAAEEVAAWGMQEREASGRLKEVLTDSEGVSDDELQSLLREHPGHPDLLKLMAERALEAGDAEAAEAAVQRYAAARPVDPWPQKALVQLAVDAGDLERAVPALEQLDLQDNANSGWSYQLAQVHRGAGRLDQAADAITRALFREPYNATYRTLAATIELQRGAGQRALHHLEALATLEPEIVQHHVRLAALRHRLGDAGGAKAAAERARELDPNAPVDAFLNEPRG